MLRILIVLILIVVTVALQALFARFDPRLTWLDLPLIVVLYLTIARESLVWTVFSGSVVGFLQDSLSLSTLGMNGFTKISIGFLAYVANSFFAIDRFVTRWVLLFISSVLASLLFWGLKILFLNRNEFFDGERIMLGGLMNACVGIPLFYLFDKIITPPVD